MSKGEPLSQRWYEVATKWAEAESAAALLEETKSATLSQMMMRSLEKSISAREMMVKASDEWTDYIGRMNKARKAANLLKVEMEYLRMRAWEENSHAANDRVMARMS